jgi:hypothetical protein
MYVLFVSIQLNKIKKIKYSYKIKKNITCSMNILKINCNLVVFGFIIFFICIICYSILLLSNDVETMSLSETANADSVKTDMLSAKVGALQPTVDKISKDVDSNTTGIKANMDVITSILKQKVNDVNKKVGKDITDKSNAPPPVTGLS